MVLDTINFQLTIERPGRGMSWQLEMQRNLKGDQS